VRSGRDHNLDPTAGQQLELPLVERQQDVHPGSQRACKDDRVVYRAAHNASLGRATEEVLIPERIENDHLDTVTHEVPCQQRSTVGGREAMRRREASQDGIGFDECRSRHNERLTPIQSPPDLPRGPLMVLVPGADQSDHAVGIHEEGRHLELALSGSLVGQCPAGILYCLSRQLLDLCLRKSNQESALADELNRECARLYLDPAIVPAHLQGHSGLDARLAPDIPRNHQTPCSVNGSLHTINTTMYGGGTDPNANPGKSPEPRTTGFQ
jgi:hypothetical protein